MKKLGAMVGALSVLTTSAVVASSAVASRPTPFTVLDTLGAATPETVFGSEGSSGVSLLATQYVGPQFTVTQKWTGITEIGGFIDGPAQVQIRPSRDGVPDSSVVIATFTLPTCSVAGHCYVSVTPEKMSKLKLRPGVYFALFAPQQGSQGGILAGAQTPFAYQAGLTLMGFLDPTTGVASASQQFGAVRILGK